MERICHLTTVHDRYDGRIFVKECCSLAKAGYEVFLVVNDPQGEELRQGVHIVSTGRETGSRIKRMLCSTRKVYQLALDIDAALYHFHDPELIPVGLKLKRRGKKVVYDSHEFYSVQLKSKPYLPRWIRHTVSGLFSLYECYALRRFDSALLATTMGGENPFQGRCPQVEIIGNEPVLAEFYDKYDDSTPKIPRSVCYMGALRKDRGILNDMLAAYKAHAKLILAGYHETGLFDELKKHEAFSCVDYRGILPREELAGLLSECRAGLYIEKDIGQNLIIDTLGTKVYEYMSMGLPVILSKCPYHVKMVEKYQFGICVDPEDVQAISQAMSYLLDHPDIAEQMGQNGRNAVKQSLNWGVEEKKLLSLYAQLLEKESD